LKKAIGRSKRLKNKDVLLVKGLYCNDPAYISGSENEEEKPAKMV